MANELDELEKKLFGSAPITKAPAPPVGKTESDLFGGPPAAKPQVAAQQQPNSAPPAPTTMLGRMRETMQAASPVPMLTMGLSDYVPALMRRGVSAIGLGPQQDVGKSVFDLKKQEQAQREAIEARHPVASTVGAVGGLAGGMALTPNVAVPRALASIPYVGKTLSPALTGGLYSGVGTLGETGSFSEAGRDATTGAITGGVLSPIVERTLGRFATRAQPTGGAQTAEDLAYETLQKAGITTPSRGVVTGDPKQLAREKTFGQDIYGNMAQQAQKAAQEFYGGPQVAPAQAAEEAVSRARTKALSEKAAAKAEYDAARLLRGTFDRDVIQNVGSKMLHDFSINPNTTEIAANKIAIEAANQLDNFLGVKVAVNPQLSVIHSNFDQVEKARQMLNEYFGAARNNSDRSAIRSMIDRFDDHIENAINNGAFSGDPNALQQWKKARKAWSQYQEKYGVKKTGSDAGSLMKTIIDEKADAVKVAEMIFQGGMSSDATMKKTAITVFDQLKRALGTKGQKINDIPELVKIKQSFLQTLMTPSGSTPADFAKTARQIDGFLTGPTRGLARTMLEGREAEALKNLSNAMKLMSRAGETSAAKRIGYIQTALEIGGPLVGSLAMYGMNAHPMLYGTVAAVGVPVGATRRYLRSDVRQTNLANRPYQPSGVPLSGAYTIVPRATMEEEPQQVPQQADGGRVGRADGGRISVEQGVRALMRAVEDAKKSVTKSTENLLQLPDEHVAQTLDAAKRHI